MDDSPERKEGRGADGKPQRRRPKMGEGADGTGYRTSRPGETE
ncbi:MAG: hypothetical protein OSA83_18325 [Pseudomonadales bacterium]|nr:hypothetical protein [Pseudomonadales bacterium]